MESLSKEKILEWYEKRISTLEGKYSTQADLQKKISIGSKLNGYKESYEYLKRHI